MKDKHDEEEGEIRHGKDDAREAGKKERQQQQRYEEERTRALENERMEDELWAPGAAPIGNIRIPQREVRFTGPEEGQTALEVLPF
ncbi:hypothetical protein MMC31_001472 [Peltigera leucophlebia]|nr:hypothetical protein [Peltigera leucophlebia]